MQFRSHGKAPDWQECPMETERSWKDFFTVTKAHWSKAQDEIDWNQPIADWTWTEYDINNLPS
jgi:hypothetical protein